MEPAHMIERGLATMDEIEHCLPTSETIVVGLGSPNGDDQIGWLVADEIARMHGSAIPVRKHTIPIDLTHALEGFARAVIIDAVRCDETPGRLRRWEWPSPDIALIRTSGTHAIGLPETLQLAAELNRLPNDVVIWGISSQNFSAGSQLSRTLQDAASRFAREIIERDLTVASAGR